MKSIINEIIDLEWNEFQQVKNKGGRASCQDDRLNFQIFRESQFMSWTKEMLESYHMDLNDAINNGRNLLSEKYARMMESTSPKDYEKIRNILPEISDEKRKLIEDVSKISVNWTEKLSKDYPELSLNGRPIHTYEDTPYTTSSETYLKGELSTYSERTLKFYYDYIKQLLYDNKNLVEIIMENTIQKYGYETLKEVEQKVVKT